MSDTYDHKITVIVHYTILSVKRHVFKIVYHTRSNHTMPKILPNRSWVKAFSFILTKTGERNLHRVTNGLKK